MRTFPTGYEALRMSARETKHGIVQTAQLASYVTVCINMALKLQYFCIY